MTGMLTYVYGNTPKRKIKILFKVKCLYNFSILSKLRLETKYNESANNIFHFMFWPRTHSVILHFILKSISPS